VIVPREEHRLLSADEIREGMRLAMAKADRRGKVILFGGYSRGDFLADIDIMVVVDAYQRDQVADTADIREHIDLNRGIALHVVTFEDYENRKNVCGTTPEEAEIYGIVLFDSRGEMLKRHDLPSVGSQSVDSETLKRRWKRLLRGDGADPRPEVAQLLANIKAALPEMEALNEDDDTEDGVYRFYYGSWKVYSLQERTEQIVTKLRALAPAQGKPLCEDFEEIVAAGTGKNWKQSHNAEWIKHTRPIVEAYFHARYFLVVAIEYGAKYEHPPSLMSSGWAALLILYGLR
jgi:predicted nucleotidyltransferase